MSMTYEPMPHWVDLVVSLRYKNILHGLKDKPVSRRIIELEEENDTLRSLVEELWTLADYCVLNEGELSRIQDAMLRLGIEV